MSRTDQEDSPHSRFFWGRIQSFRYAGQGLAFMLRTQHNAWIHAALTVIVVSAAAAFRVSVGEWCLLIVAMASVWTAESINTALEIIVDIASPEYRPAAGHAKDIGAAAVLLCSIGAAAVGVLVFVPHFAHLVAP